MLLAIDTSTRLMGLALYNGERVVWESSWTSNFHHTVELAPAVARALTQTGTALQDLEGLAVALGPGSFTSLRTGLAFVKGLAIAQNIPVIGIHTLDFLARAQVPAEIPMAAVVEAGRKRLAVGWYHYESDKWTRHGEYELYTPAAFAKKIKSPTIVCGEMSEDDRRVIGRKWKNVRLISPVQGHRRPAFLAEMAWERLQNNDSDDPVSMSPIYISQVGL